MEKQPHLALQSLTGDSAIEAEEEVEVSAEPAAVTFEARMSEARTNYFEQRIEEETVRQMYARCLEQQVHYKKTHAYNQAMLKDESNRAKYTKDNAKYSGMKT